MCSAPARLKAHRLEAIGVRPLERGTHRGLVDRLDDAHEGFAPGGSGRSSSEQRSGSAWGDVEGRRGRRRRSHDGAQIPTEIQNQLVDVVEVSLRGCQPRPVGQLVEARVRRSSWSATFGRGVTPRTALGFDAVVSGAGGKGIWTPPRKSPLARVSSGLRAQLWRGRLCRSHDRFAP